MKEGSAVGGASSSALGSNQWGGAWDLGRPVHSNVNRNFDSPASLVNELVDLALSLVMVGVYAMAWVSRNLLIFLPESVSFYNFCNALQTRISIATRNDCPAAIVEAGDDGTSVIGDGAVERALVQVLTLMNEIPPSSMKYVFARDLAEKIIQENKCHGHEFVSVNRAALTTGFNRTLELLNRTLESIPLRKSQSGMMSWSLPTKLLSLMSVIPQQGMKLVLPSAPALSQLWVQIAGLIPFVSAKGGGRVPARTSSRVLAQDLSSPIFAHEEQAEKLAQELLWLAEKLAESSALGGCIPQWSSALSLSEISLAASPRVQRALVRLAALFFDEVVNRQKDVDGGFRFKMLLLWLPLLCTATHAGDGPIFTTFERVQLEQALHTAVKALPEADQETILGIWLREFLCSSSDWPNLQPCYDEWCNTSRNLRHQLRIENHREDHETQRK